MFKVTAKDIQVDVKSLLTESLGQEGHLAPAWFDATQSSAGASYPSNPGTRKLKISERLV